LEDFKTRRSGQTRRGNRDRRDTLGGTLEEEEEEEVLAARDKTERVSGSMKR